MARLLQVKPFQLRKQALVAESEVYRQTLHLECQNLLLYGVHLKRKLARYRASTKSLLMLASAVGALVGARSRRSEAKPRQKKRGLLATALVGWRLYRRFGPLLQNLLAQQLARSKPTQFHTGQTAPETGD
ncbi:MAG TPA: hypothetical protein VNT26_01580 [Candidatus Sulfotelmatobacter sp.]|nr:hypothetical protein [Candidatus Sulfotelmatobacter sp.]HWI55714.1 hypothetical protein [Bacillota bacterium]